MFLDRDHLRQSAWWSGVGDDDENSTIFLTTYAGASTQDEIRAARDLHEDRFGYAAYSGLEFLRVDGRDAWGWTETQTRDDGRVARIEYTAVVPFDSVTYVVEFSSSEPRFLHAASLRAVVATFAVGRRRWNVPLLLLVLVLGGVVVAGGRHG